MLGGSIAFISIRLLITHLMFMTLVSYNMASLQPMPNLVPEGYTATTIYPSFTRFEVMRQLLNSYTFDSTDHKISHFVLYCLVLFHLAEEKNIRVIGGLVDRVARMISFNNNLPNLEVFYKYSKFVQNSKQSVVTDLTSSYIVTVRK